MAAVVLPSGFDGERDDSPARRGQPGYAGPAGGTGQLAAMTEFKYFSRKPRPLHGISGMPARRPASRALMAQIARRRRSRRGRDTPLRACRSRSIRATSGLLLRLQHPPVTRRSLNLPTEEFSGESRRSGITTCQMVLTARPARSSRSDTRRNARQRKRMAARKHRSAFRPGTRNLLVDETEQ